MTNPAEVIINLKKVREEKGLSFSQILSMMEENGDYLSTSTLSRVFAEGSEDPEVAKSFRYQETLRPLARVLLNSENIEEDDSPVVQGLKELLKYKMEIIENYASRIEELEQALEEEKDKFHQQLVEETAKFQKNLEFVNHQVELKDKRIDQLMDAHDRISITNNRLLNQFLNCPLKNGEGCTDEG